MNAVELQAIASRIPTPVDPNLGPCRAYVESHDGSWRAVFALEGGRRGQPVGPAFPLDRAGSRAARALVGLLNHRTDPTSRKPSPDLAALGSASRDEAAAPEAPDLAASTLAPADASRCAGCDGPLPPGRSDRRTCSPACRVATSRRRSAANASSADVGGAGGRVTPTRPSVAAVLADHGRDVIAASNPSATTDPTPQVDPGSVRSDRGLPQRPEPARDPATRAHPLGLGSFAEG